MTKIFEFQQEQWIIFFNIGKQLILQYKEGERFGRPILLANDYAGGFDAERFDGVFYYVYSNERGEILLRNTRDNLIYYQIQEEGGEVLTLSVHQGQLVFWYIGQREQGQRFLQCICPFQPRFSRQVLSGIKADDTVHLLETEQNVLVVVERGHTAQIYMVDAEFVAREIREQPEHMEEVEQLREQLNRKEDQTKQLEGMIDSAKAQYEELMHVAEHYRDEAIRWRSKFSF